MRKKDIILLILQIISDLGLVAFGGYLFIMSVVFASIIGIGNAEDANAFINQAYLAELLLLIAIATNIFGLIFGFSKKDINMTRIMLSVSSGLITLVGIQLIVFVSKSLVSNLAEYGLNQDSISNIITIVVIAVAAIAITTLNILTMLKDKGQNKDELQRGDNKI